jgi:hypothetical protein
MGVKQNEDEYGLKTHYNSGLAKAGLTNIGETLYIYST